MRFPDFLDRNAYGVSHIRVVAAPFRNVSVEQIMERRRCPGCRMNPIRNGMNRKMGKHILRDFAVPHGHSVDVPGEVNGEVGHIKHVGVCKARLLQ